LAWCHLEVLMFSPHGWRGRDRIGNSINHTLCELTKARILMVEGREDLLPIELSALSVYRLMAPMPVLWFDGLLRSM
jgi:hypothetical protein